MTSFQDRLVSVFVDKRTRELKDTDITHVMNSEGTACTTDDIRRHAQSLSPGLFQLTSNKDRTVTIQVEPKIEICQEFLGSRCTVADGTKCEKLHICRHIDGRCPKPNCTFPHDFSRGYNRKIVNDHNCQHINPVLLVKLLRIRNSATGRPPLLRTRGHRGGRGRGRGGRGRGGRGRGRNTQGYARASSTQQDDFDRQVDVSFPSSNLAKQIDMEIIGMCLNLRGINVEEKFNEHENEYCRRGTIQLQQINDVEKLLRSPIIDHHGIEIKFKRTKQLIDKTSFILRTSIQNENDKIETSRIELYVATLVGNEPKSTISDMSSDSEQIMLVQCKGEIDFLKVYQANKTRPQLLGKDITIVQVYECDALEINYNDANKSIDENDLKVIFRSVWRDIFAYNFSSETCAEVEFINADAFKQWMSTSRTIQNQFQLTVSPIIDSVDDNNDDTRSIISTASDIRPRPTTKTTIKLPPNWALIVGHTKFQTEYKDFIRNEFGGEITICDDEIIYNGNFPKSHPGSRNDVLLGNKTREFMDKFDYKTFHKLEQHHIDFLQANSADVAYERLNNNNDFLIATRANEMQEFKRKLFAKINQSVQSKPTPRLSNRVSTEKKPTPLVTSSSTLSSSMYPILGSERMSMFSIDTFEKRLEQYLQQTLNVRMICERSNTNNDKTKGTRTNIRLKIAGQNTEVEKAVTELENLFESLCKKEFNDKTDGNWTKIEDATHVIQHHFNLAQMICACQQISSTTVHVYYFDMTNPQFGTDEQKIEDLIKNRFRLAMVPFSSQSKSPKLIKDWTDLEDNIRKRDDYKRNICLSKESDTIYLFGLADLVKECRQKFEQIKHKHDIQPCQITLSERQLNYLQYVARSDMNKLEKQYKSEGCDVSLTRLRQHSEFLAPPDMHSKIKDNLQALAQIRDITFDINEPGFEEVSNKELLEIVKSKCLFEKRTETYSLQIPIPKAQVADLEDGIKDSSATGATASASSNAASVNIGPSTVSITYGDLTAQSVDAIVVCSSSAYLCKKVVGAAGPQAQQEYAVLLSADQFPSVTSGGTLPSKKIIFVPWAPESRNEADVKGAFSSFVGLAFMHALEEKCKSLAFPAVGCGQFGYDPLIIAKYMLHETKKQLKICKTKMNISFILLKDQQTVYDAFVKRLNEMETIDLSVSHKSSSTTKKDDQFTITYDRKIVKITLISSNDNHLIECKDRMLALARSVSIKTQMTKMDMLDWPQNTIYKYYDYCLKRGVIPTLDLANTTLELVGTKDAIHEAEKYFYELTSETLKKARMHAVAQGVIWSVELTPNSDTWEQYSYKSTGIIEDAFYKKLPHVEFDNDKDERCRITFSSMVEHCGKQIRCVRRKLVDSTLPKTWDPQDQNCKRVTISPTSTEYQNILGRFHVTMLGKYSQIIKIERIQNERWYKQYAAHRDDFQRRYSQINERLLFHGCPSTSADQIIKECFNRSFAGVNGVKFGHGVYFHEQAIYSHQYAPPNSSGERTTFLVRVLVGKSCKGDQSMKVCPTGYDTTTDGEHIFVVYHDAGAYADHLITYK